MTLHISSEGTGSIAHTGGKSYFQDEAEQWRHIGSHQPVSKSLQTALQAAHYEYLRKRYKL